jgi:sporulation protein YlmC with PRC-barrel domain
MLLAALLVPACSFGQDPVAPLGGGQQERASKIIGKEVKNPKGEDLGKIEDIVFNKSGKISYMVLSFSTWFGLNEKFFAIPHSAFKPGKNDKTCVLDIDKDKLKKAPGFDRKQWPDMADPKWSQEVDVYYGTPANEDRSWGGKATELRDSVLKDAGGKKLADVDDLVIDTDVGWATLIVASTGKDVEPKEKLVAIPWRAVAVKPSEKTFVLESPATLALAPSFTKDQWPEFDRPYIVRVFSHFGRDLDAERPVGYSERSEAGRATVQRPARLSQIMGARCVTQDNQDCGTLKDVLLPGSSRPPLAVIDGARDSGKLVAIPLTLIRYTSDGVCLLTVPKNKLGNAPTFTEGTWPDIDDSKWLDEVYGHYALK